MPGPYVIPALAALVVALALPAVAPGAPVIKAPTGQPTFHARDQEDFAITDFCGTGEIVSVHVEFRATVWEDDPGVFKEVLNRKVYFTYGDVTLVEHFASRNIAVVVSGAAGGARTEERIETGLKAKLMLADGRVLTSDHGLLHYLVSFDAKDNVVDVELVEEHGGHPAFTSDAWCKAATAAFGLEV